MIYGNKITSNTIGEFASITLNHLVATDIVEVKCNDINFKGEFFTKQEPLYNQQLIPIMTSNTTPSGVASASSYYSASNLPYFAFTQTKTTGGAERWKCSGSAPQWIQYEFPSEQIITAFDFLLGTDGSYSRGSTGYISISTNGTDFTTIYNFSNLAAGAIHNLSFDTSYIAKQVRWTITANNNTYSTGYGVRANYLQVYGTLSQTVQGFNFLRLNKYGLYNIKINRAGTIKDLTQSINEAKNYSIDVSF